ncbi:BRCT domain-containing DNA repair protein isoform X2 [Tasmannia lanceolata]|uniref:BRCT domain-containing DNA repair protein isoform X2 n=1 Tax=Tasmannia lanceolata TaxID=3420 RepID=UPI004062B28D
MSEAELGPSDSNKETVRRNLPSWMSSKDKGKHVDVGIHEEVYEGKKPKKSTSQVKSHDGIGEVASNMGTLQFSKLLEGVVFVLSGFVNPERSVLRSQALSMGAVCRADWTSGCTLLVCAFPNTPKYRQVETDCGTIVSKEWILECYNQKKLVEIDSYLMHAGKPWRNMNCHLSNQDQENSQSRKPHKPVEKGLNSKPIVTAKSEGGASNAPKTYLSPSKVKDWAVDDLNKTMSWLESQDEKPEPSELKKIAAEGILTCLEDSMAALEENQDIQHVTEQWKFVPHVVKELAKLENMRIQTRSLSKEELCALAISCKDIYQKEFDKISNSPVKNKRQKTDEGGEEDSEKTEVMSDNAGFDSDETIEMGNEEVDLACKRLASKHCK